MKVYVIFDYIQEGFVSSLRKNAYGTSRCSCDALRFPCRDIALSFVTILESLYSDTHFAVMAI